MSFISRHLKGKVLRLLTKRNPKNLNLSEINSIIVLRYDRLGDMVVSLPLIKALKTGMPKASMTVVASRYNECIVRHSAFVDEVIIKPSNVILWLSLLTSIRRRKISLTVDLNHAVAPHAIFACFLINAQHNASPYKDGRWGVDGSELKMFDIMPPKHELRFARPVACMYLDIAKDLGLDISQCLPYPVTKTGTLKHQHLSKPYIMLNYRGSHPSTRLPDALISVLVKKLSNILPGTRIILFPLAEDYADLKRLLKEEKNSLVCEPSPNVLPVISSLADAALVITPDTSLVHLASAFSKPLIAIYKSPSESYLQWQPLNDAPTRVIFQSEIRTQAEYIDSILDALESVLR